MRSERLDQKTVLIIVLILLICVMSFINYMKISEFVDIKTNIKLVENEIKEYKENIEAYSDINKDIEQLQQQSDKLKKLIPDQREEDGILECIAVAGEYAGVNVKGVSFGQDEKSWKYMQTNIIVNVDCSYKSLVDYIHLLEKSDRMIKVESIDITRGESGYLKGEMSLKAYYSTSAQ